MIKEKEEVGATSQTKEVKTKEGTTKWRAYFFYFLFCRPKQTTRSETRRRKNILIVHWKPQKNLFLVDSPLWSLAKELFFVLK